MKFNDPLNYFYIPKNLNMEIRFIINIGDKMANDEKEITVVGMHCPSCVAAVELSLKDIDGVDNAKADLETGIVEIELDCDKVSDSDLIEAVEEAGFKVE